MNQQEKVLEKFRKGEIKVLLLNTSHFGAGLDLHMTTDLVIYHKFRNNERVVYDTFGEKGLVGLDTGAIYYC